jgi:hypothetical protein
MLPWITAHLDWLLTAVFVAGLTAAVVAIRDGVRGSSVFLGIASSSVVTVALYPVADKFGYAGPFALLLGLLCGVGHLALFQLLLTLRDAIIRRAPRIGNTLIDKVLPESKEPPP